MDGIALEPDLVLFVILPPLLWSAGLESSYVALRKNTRRIGLLAVGLPLATTFAVGVVAFHTVPELTVAAALTLGAIVAPPDAVSAAAIGRRLGLPRQIMTLLGGESLLNDATALTAYKVALAAAIGTAASVGHADPAPSRWPPSAAPSSAGAMGSLIVCVRTWLGDSLVESAIGLVAPFFIYLLAEEVHGSGVIAVVVAALILGQRSTRASYATRLQDTAVWRTLQFVLESFAFLLIGLQLPTVVAELKGISAASAGDRVGRGAGDGDRRPHRLGVRDGLPAAQAVAAHPGERGERRRPPRSSSWRGRGCAAWCRWPPRSPCRSPRCRAHRSPGRPQLVFLTFVVVVGTLLLHGLTLPWIIKVLDVQGDDAHQDALDEAAAQTKAAQAAADRLDELHGRATRRTPTSTSGPPRSSGTGTTGAATRRGSSWAAATTRSARVPPRRSGGCGWRC